MVVCQNSMLSREFSSWSVNDLLYLLVGIATIWTSAFWERDEDYANQDETDKLEPVEVKKVLLAPQGSAKYEVEYNDAEPLSVVLDNWKLGRAQPCKRGGVCKGGRRTLQFCLVSLECANKKCAYLKIQNSPNRVDFNRSKCCVHVTVKPLKSIAQWENMLKTTGATKNLQYFF